MVISCDHGGHPQPIHWFQKWKSFKLTLLTYLLHGVQYFLRG